MEDRNNEMPALTESGIEIYTLLHDILVNWWVILLGALAGAMLTYVVANVRYVPEYTSKTTFVVASRGDSNAFSNLMSANSMAKTFQKILKSNVMEKTICEKMKIDELNAEITADVLEGTNLLVLSVTASTPKDSIDIMRTIMDNYTTVSMYTVGDTVMDVLEDPQIPYAPDNPLNAKGTTQKGAAGCAALIIFLLGMESYMKNTVKQEKEIERKLDARSLGAIRHERKYKTIRDLLAHKKKTVLVDNPVASFSFVESYKKLAAKVEYQMAKHERKILMVTSVAENEGKSTVAANLAITLAQQGKKVLLVDGDVRRPSQFLILDMRLSDEKELGEYLKGNNQPGDIMMQCSRKNLFFIGGRNCYRSSSELLNTDRLGKLMEACRKYVDYIIIDTSPAGAIVDAHIFADCADAVMIVARQNYIMSEDINEVIDDFRDSHRKVLGIVLNDVQSFEGMTESSVSGRYGKYGRYANYSRSKGK